MIVVSAKQKRDLIRWYKHSAKSVPSAVQLRDRYFPMHGAGRDA